MVARVARIHRPAKTVMQAGAREGGWRLEFEAQRPHWREGLMGWTAAAEMEQQVSLHFGTLEQAIAYARDIGIPFRVEPHQPDQTRPHKRTTQTYADNFKASRPIPWTH